MSDQTFQDCQYCDERSDRAGGRATANSLRDYMTRNHIGFVVDKGMSQPSFITKISEDYSRFNKSYQI